MCWIWYLGSSLHTQCTVLTFIKYIGFFQDTLEQDPAHLYNYSIWFFYSMLTVYKWPISFYVVLLWSLMMVTCESKHVGNTCVIMQYIYLRNSFLYFVDLVSWISKENHFQFHKIMLKCIRLCLHSSLWKPFGSETSSCCALSQV